MGKAFDGIGHGFLRVDVYGTVNDTIPTIAKHFDELELEPVVADESTKWRGRWRAGNLRDHDGDRRRGGAHGIDRRTAKHRGTQGRGDRTARASLL